VPHTVAEPSSDLILPSAESLQQEEISRVLEARMSNRRDTPAHQIAKRSHVTPVRVGDQRDHPDCENRSEGGLAGEDDRAGQNGRHGVFDDQQCPPRLQCEGEQHTGSDRIHTAGNGEEPAIQFGTRLLIGLQQHPGRGRHQHHTTTKKRPASAATTRKMCVLSEVMRSVNQWWRGGGRLIMAA
jgi:hypothetical protein